mmetsp:Transcript_21087/g.66607  ORF Transcript_21087/g.66607 Transcript_21087/m.66607 type:complete len:204 (+) Transcript_21087:267-878(+)
MRPARAAAPAGVGTAGLGRPLGRAGGRDGEAPAGGRPRHRPEVRLRGGEHRGRGRRWRGCLGTSAVVGARQAAEAAAASPHAAAPSHASAAPLGPGLRPRARREWSLVGGACRAPGGLPSGVARWPAGRAPPRERRRAVRPAGEPAARGPGAPQLWLPLPLPPGGGLRALPCGSGLRGARKGSAPAGAPAAERGPRDRGQARG